MMLVFKLNERFALKAFHYICSLRKPAELSSCCSRLTLHDPVLRIALQINYEFWQSVPTGC